MNKKFYGWTMLAALFLLEFVNMGFPFYGGGVINTYMLKHMAMSRSTYGLGFTILNLFIGVPSPLIVRSILRLGLRGTFVIGSVLICIGALWMNFVAVQPWQYLLGFGVIIGSGVGFGTIVPISTGVTRWFKRSRGKAMAIAFSASGCAGFICVPFFNKLLTANGGDFHAAWLMVAGVSATGALFAWFLIKESPAALGQTPDGASPTMPVPAVEGIPIATDREWSAKEVYRTPAFWSIMLGSISCQFPFFFFNAHALLHMKDNGIEPQIAAWALGTFTAVGILGRVVGGWLLDRIRAQVVFAVGLVAYVAGSLIATHIDAHHPIRAFAAAACYGWGFGCSWVSLHTIIGNFFGVAVYPRLNGTMMIVSSLLCAPAGIIGGKLFDVYHSYTPAFYLNAALALIGVVSLSLTKIPRQDPKAV